jgi:hypothetical protein
VELHSTGLGGANFVKLDCTGLGGKLFGSGLDRFWGAYCVVLDSINFGAYCVELYCLGFGGKLCGTGLYSFGGKLALT